MIRCIDLETTGLNQEDGTGERHGIVEAGWCDLDDGEVRDPRGTLVSCGKESTIGALAVHHIRDEVAATGIKPDALMPLITGGAPAYYAAHNVDYEKQFFGGGETPWLCTYKGALRAWPDAPGHKLQELRYFLRVDDEPDFDPSLAERPHRAPDDAYVCAFVLRRLLLEVNVVALARWSRGPALLYVCWLKKHKGTPWKDVPRDYLDWVVNKSDITDRDVRATAKYYLTRRT